MSDKNKGKTNHSEPVKARNEKQLRAQNTASNAALIVSILLLAAIFLLSSLSLSRLEGEAYPLIDEAIAAAHYEDFVELGRITQKLERILAERESEMKIYASHRDIADIMRCCGELTALGDSGEKDDYIESLAGIRVMLRMLRENNCVSLGNVL